MSGQLTQLVVITQVTICSRDTVFRTKMDDGYSGLPADFDINDNIPTLTQQLKKVPLKMYFYNLLKRMELNKAKRDGRT